MTPGPSFPAPRRPSRLRPRAGAGVTVLFLAGLAVSAAAAILVGPVVEPATAQSAPGRIAGMAEPAAGPASPDLGR